MGQLRETEQYQFSVEVANADVAFGVFMSRVHSVDDVPIPEEDHNPADDLVIVRARCVFHDGSEHGTQRGVEVSIRPNATTSVGQAIDQALQQLSAWFVK